MKYQNDNFNLRASSVQGIKCYHNIRQLYQKVPAIKFF
jgi:hypothetical protein